MSLYGGVRTLDLEIEDIRFQLLRSETSSDFTRVSTEIELYGDGVIGRGEDVTYDEELHPEFVESVRNNELELGLEGTYTYSDFSRKLGDLDLFPQEPRQEVFRSYRRWGFESAALDLALRQKGESLGEVLGEELAPLRFVVSTRLGDPPSTERLEKLLDVNPDLEFKLDPTPEWTPDLVQEIKEMCGVRILDLKGQYEDTEVDNPADPELYRLVLDRFPEAVIEDPDLGMGLDVLDGNRDRVSWDYPITSIDSILDLPFEPCWINVKPSRFGSVQSLFDTIEYCKDNGVSMYGGGQFELGVGRRQIQELAALFYPGSPNDVAPSEYNSGSVGKELPTSPLVLGEGVGFG